MSLARLSSYDGVVSSRVSCQYGQPALIFWGVCTVLPDGQCSQGLVRVVAEVLLVFRNHIIMEDLEAFLSPEQAQEAFDMLDNNGDGKLVLADIRDAVIKIYKERRNLALSLKV